MNAANVSEKTLITICVWLSSSGDLRLSVEAEADQGQQAAGIRVQRRVKYSYTYPYYSRAHKSRSARVPLLGNASL